MKINSLIFYVSVVGIAPMLREFLAKKTYASYTLKLIN